LHTKLHITPEDDLADIDEIPDGSEPRSRCRYFIEPYGQYGINEVCEANYYVGNRVPYHEHLSGFETFLVDGGALEVLTLSRKAVARKGDIVHITPFTPHSIHSIEDNSIWRAFHQGLWLTKFMIEERDLRDRHWDTFFDPEFKRDTGERNGSKWFDYALPECEDVAPDKLPCLRPYDFALAEYSFEGITLRLKVGRWETLGAKEVWQLFLSGGYKLSWEKTHPYSLLYDVFSGSVRVTLENGETFIANARDLIHIPKFLGGEIEALEDTVLLDPGCQGYLTRFMDEVNHLKQKEPAKLRDREHIRAVMRKNDYNVLFGSL
jgi:quercetin dioxygenase-like cupin family protein